MFDLNNSSRYIRSKIKAYTYQTLPRSILRGLFGSLVGIVDWEYWGVENGVAVLKMRDTQYNALSDQGEQDILETFYVNISVPPSDIFIGLSNTTLGETSTLAGLTEVSGSGYARQTISRSTTGWPTRQLNAGDWQITSQQRTFSATGTWTTANYAFLCSVSSGTSGRIWNYLQLSSPVTLNNGESLSITWKVQLQ